MKQQLNLFLCLRITVRIAAAVWFLQVLCITWNKVIVVGTIGEVNCVIPMYFGVVWSDVERWTFANTRGTAPGGCFWVNNHLAISSYISEQISIIGGTIVLPAAPYVN
ncbi:Uncharacterized protein Fot_18640 [Forsythia ovata]|uniref:Uncharacterized protein n=1 Tax=Forsythia ovata TaxID=205694 RepID=A0ABD1VIS1_9LAMI